MSKAILVCGGGGFIGNHLVSRLVAEGNRVRAADLVPPSYAPSATEDFMIGDLRDPAFVRAVIDQPFDEIYQLAADMGGAGYIFSGDNDAEIMRNSALVNFNVIEAAVAAGAERVFYSSSACIYPEHNQMDPQNPRCDEASAYPAAPDSEYGWEKLFSERLYQAYARNKGIVTRVARYHNVFGPQGAWNNGKEKAPAAICRKVAAAQDGGEIEIWGDGEQTRSFLFIDQCLEATIRLMRSDVSGPVNIGSERMISINGLVDLVSAIGGKKLIKRHIDGPTGVRGRCSDNRLIAEQLGWKPAENLEHGLAVTYDWISAQLNVGLRQLESSDR